MKTFKRTMILLTMFSIALTACNSTSTNNPSSYSPPYSTSPVTTRRTQTTTSVSEETEEESEPILVFGTFIDEPLEWIILDSDDEKTLVLSKYILSSNPFYESTMVKESNWAESTLRSTLNISFYEEAFSDDEKEVILTTIVEDPCDYRKSNRLSENKLFILNLKQVAKYFPTEEERKAPVARFALSAKTKRDIEKNHYTKPIYSDWWIMDGDALYKKSITEKGKVHYGPRVNESSGLRPAMWIKTDYVNDYFLSIEDSVNSETIVTSSP